MSEIVKCPCCSGTLVPAIYNDYCECKNCWFRCDKAALPRIVVAMELAMATANFGNAFGADELRIDGEEGDEQVNALNNATLRVLEVFK